MCELLALSFNRPVDIGLSFRGFRRRGRDNPDGWGIAWYPGYPRQGVRIVKEPVSAEKGLLSNFFLRNSKVRSRVFVAHVRRTSKGEKLYSNTHPFYRMLGGREFCFAHNGTLKANRLKDLELRSFLPIGETDSEHAFCHILNCIDERSLDFWKKGDFEWLHEKFSEIDTIGTFNCLLSDGEYLFCYHDEGGYRGLFFLHREAPFATIQLKDEDYVIDLQKVKKADQRGYVIATQPLTDEEWKPFGKGELKAFRNGELVFSSV